MILIMRYAIIRANFRLGRHAEEVICIRQVNPPAGTRI
jgi:hypothetical protein